MAGERLLAMIRASELVERLKMLAGSIASDSKTMSRYGALLALQKRLVAGVVKRDRTLADRLQADYAAALDGLADVPVVAEYLALVDELDDVAQEVAAILNGGFTRI